MCFDQKILKITAALIKFMKGRRFSRDTHVLCRLLYHKLEKVSIDHKNDLCQNYNVTSHCDTSLQNGNPSV